MEGTDIIMYMLGGGLAAGAIYLIASHNARDHDKPKIRNPSGLENIFYDIFSRNDYRQR